MMNNKTFRLFISSTFNDFRKEREILQRKVFPTIKEYASKQDYIFQPIDLRWGVSTDAQLDQKTLELCLNEVKACKTHLHPNFLIMIGDRYGWIPLPYAIEQEEFETITKHISDTTLLDAWYALDLNQIPASYILKERTNEYKDYDTWVEVENTLRDALQEAVDLSTLTEEQKRKYFLSATEAEVEEGIIPYLNPTKFQRDILLKKNVDLHTVDPQHIFGFFRDIDKITQVEDKFIMHDYDEAQAFKQRVIPILLNENRLQVETIQIDKESLEESYLKEFEERMLTFLKSQIDTQKKKEVKRELTLLQEELSGQKYFAANKRKDFLGQKLIRKKIADYIANKEHAPLVIYGKSGSGKSALISQAIQEAQEEEKKRILYRFISATPNSSLTKEILASIFEELGIDVRSEKEKEKKEEGSFSLDINNKQETFEEFSYRIHAAIQNTKEDLVIFIDAVDQLQNNDQFLWLPQTLPSNVKIVISALEDETYSDDSRFFQVLKTKTTNLHKISEFHEAEELLVQLLKNEDRTVDDFQKEHFLEQFEKVKSPLYVNIAAQEMKNWKSGDKSQTLANTQQGIIKEFITNLTKVYHHDERFVQKVLGYIYASQDGLSESELLQLLEVDEEFVKLMADEEFHENHTLKLPLVHWSRLQTQLKPFLSLKKQDGEEILNFFHREFENILEDSEDQQTLHKDIIKAIQKMILKYQNNNFYNNRWGILYILLITKYNFKYKIAEESIRFLEFILTLENVEWISRYIAKCSDIAYTHHLNYRTVQANTYAKNLLYITQILYQKNPKQWGIFYIYAMNDLAAFYNKSREVDQAIKLGELSLSIVEKLYKNNPDKWIEGYTIALTNLALFYKKVNKSLEAIKLEELCLKVFDREIQRINLGQWCNGYYPLLNNLVSSYYEVNRIPEAIRLGEKNLEMVNQLYQNDSVRWIDDYLIALNNLAIAYNKDKRVLESIKLAESSLKILQALYQNKPERWAEGYTATLMNLALFYKENNRVSEAIKLEEKSLEILSDLYQKNPLGWAEGYTNVLSYLGVSYMMHNRIADTIDILEKYIIILKELYGTSKNQWEKIYLQVFDNLVALYQSEDRENDIKKLKKEHKYASGRYGCFMTNRPQISEKEPGRNDPCTCGSRKKYKKCCGRNK